MSKAPHSQRRAADHVHEFALKHAGQTIPADGLIKFLIEMDRLAALDLQDCRTDQQKLKVYTVIVAAQMHVQQLAGADAEASRELYDALTNLALGVPQDDRLKRETVPSQKPAKTDM